MKYNFDEKIDRTGNHSAKWEEMGLKFTSKDLWPMWIADMDFKTAPEIIEAMEEKVKQGIFGYVYRPAGYYQAAANWIKNRFDYEIPAESLINSPGVVPTLSMLIRQMTQPGDKVIIQSPVYYPFAATIRDNGRTVVENKLVKDDRGYYTMDLEDFEKKIVDNKIKLFIFCSPHNPVGRVWKREELVRITDICLKHGVRIISDEIWRDMIMPGHKHIPTASISKEVEDITITCFSPTKTFNLAGLQASFVTFPRKDEWKKFDTELGILDIKRNSPFSLVAFQTAYEKCADWIDQLVEYIDGNMKYVMDYIAKNIPEVKVYKPEGTYLMWLDFSGLNMDEKELSLLIQKEGKIALDDGYWFGETGVGYERMNVACPRYMVEEGLKRIETAVKKWRAR